MRILHIIDSSTPEDVLLTLALITRQVEAQHQVLALGHQSVMRAAIAAGVNENVISFARATGWWDPAGWHSVHQTYYFYQPDHLHCWGYWALVAAALPKRLAAVRMVSLHTQPTPAELWLLRMASRRSRWFVLCGTQDLFEQMRRAGLLRDQLAYVPPAVPEITSPRIAPAQLREILELPADDHPVIFLGGTPHVHNRQDQGLWAAAILQHIYPQAHALIRLGHLDHAPVQAHVQRLLEFAQDLAHPGMMHFVEPDIPVQTVLQTTDIMLFTPDQDVDVTVMLQAMAAGIPVVATRVPGTVNIVDDSHSAILTPVEEPWPLATAAHQLIGNPQQAEEQVIAARRRVETEFSSARLAERFASIYRQLYVAPQQPLAMLA